MKSLLTALAGGAAAALCPFGGAVSAEPPGYAGPSVSSGFGLMAVAFDSRVLGFTPATCGAFDSRFRTAGADMLGVRFSSWPPRGGAIVIR